MNLPRVGERIAVHSVKYDGKPHRWWESVVRASGRSGVLLETAEGTWMHEPNGGWRSGGGLTYMWWDRWYNVYKAFDGSGSPLLYYVHVALPPRVSEGGRRITYVDLELDVVMEADGTVRVVDEDEFRAARDLYGYSDELVARAQATAEAVRRLLLAARAPWEEFEQEAR